MVLELLKYAKSAMKNYDHDHYGHVTSKDGLWLVKIWHNGQIFFI